MRGINKEIAAIKNAQWLFVSDSRRDKKRHQSDMATLKSKISALLMPLIMLWFFL